MKKMTKKLNSLAAVMGLCLSMAQADLLAGDFAVVINAQNTYSGDAATTQSLLKRLYLKQLTAWPDKAAASVYAAPDDSPEMQAFRSQVLGMTEAELADYWLGLKQKTGETPPRDMKSGTTLFKLIGKYPGAYGIVAKDALGSNPDGVKVLLEFDAK